MSTARWVRHLLGGAEILLARASGRYEPTAAFSPRHAQSSDAPDGTSSNACLCNLGCLGLRVYSGDFEV